MNMVPLVHTVGPANREVPESAIAEQPLPQNPASNMLISQQHKQYNRLKP